MFLAGHLVPNSAGAAREPRTRRRMEFVCCDLHLNRVDARAQLDRSTVMGSLEWDWFPEETSSRKMHEILPL